MNTTEFRKEVCKIMPGYRWTVHNQLLDKDGKYLSATGIQSSGFNRLSTLKVVRTDRNGTIKYEVMYAGYGKKSPWLSSTKDGTLARALRGLQEHFEAMARTYTGAANDLQTARKV